MPDRPASLHFRLGEIDQDQPRVEWLVAEFARQEPTIYERWRSIEGSPYDYDPEAEVSQFHVIADRVFAYLARTCTFDTAATPSSLWLEMKRVVASQAS